ncbi:hypothetical protein CHARACLAT_027816 [Characodon lateralis]|uniref:Uncharacterized protein n=1 Tax=Characodon lateralis TaxID=208331 RepID=A0ABU7DCK2_9TELE|nr:hypothetical protein [Characodon lateralis]
MRQLHWNNTFKQVVQEVRWEACDRMKEGETFRKNTTVFNTIIFLTAIALNLLNRIIMNIFCSHHIMPCNSIFCLHFCSGDMTKPAKICRPETFIKTSKPIGSKVIRHNRVDSAFKTFTKSVNVDTYFL